MVVHVVLTPKVYYTCRSNTRELNVIGLSCFIVEVFFSVVTIWIHGYQFDLWEKTLSVLARGFIPYEGIPFVWGPFSSSPGRPGRGGPEGHFGVVSRRVLGGSFGVFSKLIFEVSFAIMLLF